MATCFSVIQTTVEMFFMNTPTLSATNASAWTLSFMTASMTFAVMIHSILQLESYCKDIWLINVLHPYIEENRNQIEKPRIFHWRKAQWWEVWHKWVIRSVHAGVKKETAESRGCWDAADMAHRSKWTFTQELEKVLNMTLVHLLREDDRSAVPQVKASYSTAAKTFVSEVEGKCLDEGENRPLTRQPCLGLRCKNQPLG